MKCVPKPGARLDDYEKKAGTHESAMAEIQEAVAQKTLHLGHYREVLTHCNHKLGQMVAFLVKGKDRSIASLKKLESC